MGSFAVFHLAVFIEAIPVHVPPNEIHKIGQLNRACRAAVRVQLLLDCPQFASDNLHNFIISSNEFGFNWNTLAQLHPKSDASTINFNTFPPVWDKPSWRDLIPNAFPLVHRKLVFDSLHQALTTCSMHPALKMHDDDFVLVLFWLCFFGDCGAVEKWIPRLLGQTQNRTSFPGILTGAFCFACESGDLGTANAVLESGLVQLESCAAQALVESAKLGHVGIVEMLLGRVDLDFQVEPLHSCVDVARAGALENDRLLVIECVEANHLRWEAL
ncbi:hypothetical protein HDU98_010071 [Podochytrium sp. JEL0797]|nr:hypothetical protein HDU98_010071 [Podochytrium sp. JEL0797]